MLRYIIKLYTLLANTYSYIFSKKYFRFINEVFYNLSLKAKGYTNYGSLFLTGEKYFIKILAKSNPSLCIDIGANIGNFSQYLIKNTSSNIIAFEPLKKAFADLKKIEIPESLKNNLSKWQFRLPIREDFKDSNYLLFYEHNWIHVLYGLNLINIKNLKKHMSMLNNEGIDFSKMHQHTNKNIGHKNFIQLMRNINLN